MLLPIPLGLLFRRSLETMRGTSEPGHTRIRCPACGWQPARSDRWRCSPGCGNVWNTFETHGVCSGCGKAWLLTACLRCHVWSPHDAWYEDPPRQE